MLLSSTGVMRILRYALLPICVALATMHATAAAKTVRVEHGRPVVMASDTAVLVIEFLKDPKNALVPHDDPDWRHCRDAGLGRHH